MTTEKRYKILNTLPAYEPTYVPVIDSVESFYSERFPVRFYKTDGTEWIANFQPGWTDLKQIIEFGKTQNLLVIATSLVQVTKGLFCKIKPTYQLLSLTELIGKQKEFRRTD